MVIGFIASAIAVIRTYSVYHHAELLTTGVFLMAAVAYRLSWRSTTYCVPTGAGLMPFAALSILGVLGVATKVAAGSLVEAR